MRDRKLSDSLQSFNRGAANTVTGGRKGSRSAGGGKAATKTRAQLAALQQQQEKGREQEEREEREQRQALAALAARKAAEEGEEEEGEEEEGGEGGVEGASGEGTGMATAAYDFAGTKELNQLCFMEGDAVMVMKVRVGGACRRGVYLTLIHTFTHTYSHTLYTYTLSYPCDKGR
jgi:hypothetical protein